MLITRVTLLSLIGELSRLIQGKNSGYDEARQGRFSQQTHTKKKKKIRNRDKRNGTFSRIVIFASDPYFKIGLDIFQKEMMPGF